MIFYPTDYRNFVGQHKVVLLCGRRFAALWPEPVDNSIFYSR